MVQGFVLAGAMPPRFRALIVTAALSGLRWGELAALRRSDLDLNAGTVRVARKLAVLNGRVEFGPPQSAAGVRVVALPAAAVNALTEHMAEFVGANPESLVFTGAKSQLLRSSSFGRATSWHETVAELGLGDFRFHDLRHHLGADAPDGSRVDAGGTESTSTRRASRIARSPRPWIGASRRPARSPRASRRASAGRPRRANGSQDHPGG
ncbi:tyrosine-type recombinase/integrase [Actinoplanes sp. HUAS TT8]|uniref:tyrosine-type recombinase/integrase n=1 Tax=Actinoplanes sp. HUAS TT8 TaxID=3447453 RepID=UPI003F525166